MWYDMGKRYDVFVRKYKMPNAIKECVLMTPERLEEIKQAYPEHATIKELLAHIDALQRTIEELQADKERLDSILDDTEMLAEQVHISWMNEKVRQGFHCPMQCPNFPRKPVMMPQEGDVMFEKYCDKCHTDLYAYNHLPEHIKEYDRVTVRTVREAIDNANNDKGA